MQFNLKTKNWHRF